MIVYSRAPRRKRAPKQPSPPLGVPVIVHHMPRRYRPIVKSGTEMSDSMKDFFARMIRPSES